MQHHQLLRYNRHILLPQIDLKGQERIINSKIMIIGCGGLGCAAIPILAASGVGQLTIIDDDKVELSNLQRQTYYTSEDIDQFKVDVMARFITKQNDDVKVTVYKQRLSSGELSEIMQSHDVVLDCSDNLLTRQRVNQAAFIQKIPLVFASAIRFEGQLSVFDANDILSPCYACLFDGKDSGQDSCSFTGVFAPLVSTIGAMQASEALKIIAKIGNVATGKLLHYNALNFGFYMIDCERNPHCRVCGHQ